MSTSMRQINNILLDVPTGSLQKQQQPLLLMYDWYINQQHRNTYARLPPQENELSLRNYIVLIYSNGNTPVAKQAAPEKTARAKRHSPLETSASTNKQNM